MKFTHYMIMMNNGNDCCHCHFSSTGIQDRVAHSFFLEKTLEHLNMELR